MAQYTAGDIEVLEGLESVRRRPGMYAGDVRDGSGLSWTVWGLVSNSLNQVLAGNASKVDVSIEEDGSVTVEDDGLGLPIEPFSCGTPAAEALISRLRAGGRFRSTRIAFFEVRLEGAGLAVVNGLAARLRVDIYRSGFHYSLCAAAGRITEPLLKLEETTRHGTRVSFLPDPTVFHDPLVESGPILAKLRDFAHQHQGVELTFVDRRVHRLVGEGIEVFFSATRAAAGAPRGGVFHATGCFDEIDVEVAVEWSENERFSSVESFVNLERTIRGGTHHDALLEALTVGVLEDVAGAAALEKDRQGRLITGGLHAVVRVGLQWPDFDGDRQRLASLEVRKAIVAVTGRAFRAHLRTDDELRQHLVKRVARVSKR